MKTKDETLIKALRILSDEIQSVDGVTNAAILEAANRLEELTQNQWISVDDRLPDDISDNEGQVPVLFDIMLFGNIVSDISTGYFDKEVGKWYFWDSDNIISSKVTHWMPLPEPP